MHLHREAFQRVGNIVRTNGRLPESYFWEYLRDTCAVTQAVAIRRQAEQGPRVCSLGRLLLEISEDSKRVTALEPRRGRGGTVDVQPDRVVVHRVLRGVQRFGRGTAGSRGRPGRDDRGGCRSRLPWSRARRLLGLIAEFEEEG